MPKLHPFGEPEPPKKPPKAHPPPPPPTLFEQLFPCSWRGIVFPVSSIRVSLSQDLVEHKYWGVDAASVEATGRAPLQIEAVIPFVNGIVPGKGEKFGVLYPTTFREFVSAFQDKGSGILNHPEFSGILCKPHSLDFAHQAQQRDGVEVTARWVETVDPDQDAADFNTLDSPIKEAELAALDLDASKDDILKLAPEAAFPEETFDSLVNKMSGFVDSTTNAVLLTAQKPNQLFHRVQTLQNSLERARSAVLWAANESCENLKAGCLAWRDAINTVEKLGRKVKRYTAPTAMTLAALAASTGSTVDDLIKLNPQLLAKAEVAANTVVRYFA